jgi:hypothetical protein
VQRNRYIELHTVNTSRLAVKCFEHGSSHGISSFALRCFDSMRWEEISSRHKLLLMVTMR